ncbi:ergosterol biosynthetic protein 28 [Zea mays]|uniref:Ergosterol biosynthetic protein 28 n=1 Tax=Zea mays TaxID=4577 RepID=A0A1D6MR33_MAIZE|nr:ergosterol biosynthetic protein 28 [Zea mays]ONM31457.1 Ergosterol biosynthetic protein 28 [Zea mays]|eukprot:XP_008673931.1 ergosterol biosynthetic protein 28 [Zea mays]
MAHVPLKLKKRGMPALGWWLMAVGSLRSAFTWSCFFGSASLCSATYSEIQVTGVHGRTVAVWTLLSCTLCFLCAFNLSSKPLYAATFLSIVYAIGHLSVECVVYHTISAASLAPFTFITVTTMVWMLLQWNSDGHNPRPGRSTSKQP